MEAFFGKFLPYLEQVIPERFLVDSINLSILKLLAIVLSSMVLSSTLTHLYEGFAIPKAPMLTTPAVLYPTPIVCPTPKPRGLLGHHWKPTPNNNGENF